MFCTNAKDNKVIKPNPNVFLTPINQINSVIETYPKGIAGFRRYLDLLNPTPDEKDNLNAMDVKHLNGDIEYKDVTFGYEGKGTVLSNINFNVKRGETIALVCPSEDRTRNT